MTIDEAISISAEVFLSDSDIDALCIDLNCSRPQAFDALAREVAERYMNHRLDFEVADVVMNDVWGHAVALPDIPTFMYEVYEAFDAGEYEHTGDPSGIDSAEKYTRPALARILVGHVPT